MRILLSICVFSIFGLCKGISIINVSGDGNCDIEGLNDSDWGSKTFGDHIKDVDINRTIFNNTFHNIKDAQDCQSEHCYFSISLTNGYIQIVANENLTKIDGDYKNSSSTKEITQSVQFDCETGTRTLFFKVTVEDTNNHDPEFSQKSFSFTLPMPMPAGVDLTIFGDVIKAKDLDFSNHNVTFTTANCPDLLLEQQILKDDEFPYQLHIQFTKTVHISDSITCQLEVTDVADSPRSSYSDLVFNVDKKHSDPYIPIFTQPSFFYNYDPDTPSVTPMNGEQVTLKEETSDIQCNIEGDFRNYFDTPTVNGAKVEIKLKKELPPEQENVVRAKLACFISDTSDSKGYTDIVISLPEDIGTNVNFSKPLYSGTYTVTGDQHNVKLDEPIVVNGATEGVSIKVDDTFSDYFSLVSTTNNEWNLVLLSNLPSTILATAILNVPIKLIDGKSRAVDKSMISLMLPNGKEGVKFTLPIINGNYSVDESKQGTLSIDGDITLNSDYVTVKSFKLIGDNKDYFSATFNRPKSFSITTQGTLPDEIIQRGLLQLTLEAEITLGEISQTVDTVIILQLSKSDTTTTTTMTSTSTTDSTSSTTDSSTSTTHSSSSTTHSSSSSTASSSSTTASSSSTTDSTSSAADSSTSTTDSSSSTTKQPDNNCNNECSYTVWIIVTIILCVILVLFVAAVLFYYFKKIRTTVDLNPTEFNFEQNYQKKLSRERGSKDIATRRPTGYIRYNPNLDEELKDEGDEELNNNTEANKSIAPFNEPVRKLSENDGSLEIDERKGSTEKPQFLSRNDKTVGFTQPELETNDKPMALNEELKKAIEERGMRLS